MRNNEYKIVEFYKRKNDIYTLRYYANEADGFRYKVFKGEHEVQFTNTVEETDFTIPRNGASFSKPTSELMNAQIKWRNFLAGINPSIHGIQR